MSPASLRCLIAGALMLGLSACPRVATPIDDGDPPVCGDELRESEVQLQLSFRRELDILFVIDNSGSMAEEQARLVAAAGELIDRLDAAGVSYRLGFTTTDNGNPWCPAGATTPEAGNLVLSSCETRLDEFVFNNGEVDARDLACGDPCTLDAAALAITPTRTGVDEAELPRPWIESLEGVTNLPPDTDIADAFACFAPQGISGCGFESPLESMYLALVRMLDSDEPSYGFLRVDASLAIVVLTDEVDCSYDRDWSEIFETDGSKAFWSDPAAAFPTSAVCWNAGVACVGDPNSYDACEPADKIVDGSEAVGGANAVLHPISRYLDWLEAIEIDKLSLDTDNELLLTLIAGVEGGGESWSVRYAEAADPDYQQSYGIGPGCTGADGQSAVPPVRMRALAEQIDPLGLHSVCSPDYGPALAELGDRITAKFGPLCVPSCVADVDPSTPQLDVDCQLEFVVPGEDAELVAECVRDDGGHYLIDPATGSHLLPDGTDLCYASLVDPDGSETADPHDDMSPACADLRVNLEVEIVRRPGVPLPEGASLSLGCNYSDCPDEDCPGLS